MKTKQKWMAVTIATTLTLALAVPSFGALRKVDQSVFGMDCAPCAYGVEKGLKKLDGVKDVKVSLNKGDAVIELKRDNKINMEEIRKVITNGGFTPKDAKVEVSGKLRHEGQNLVLATENSTQYRLSSTDQAKDVWNKLRKMADGAQIVVKGDVPEKEPTQIRVREVSES